MKIFIKTALLCLLAISRAAAQQPITGIVTDAATGETLIGVSVGYEGSTVGTVTELDGSFSIEKLAGSETLVFSYVGYETQRIEVAGRSQIDVAMSVSVSQLEEVVVVGYGSQKRSKISGSVSVLTSEEITETPVLRTEQALQGRTAGVLVAQNSGSPGAALTVRVRGTGTINGADPLYVVDGVPVDGLDYLNPNDIESINVLKDAASAAIYGSRGANGVVLITTKGGKKNQSGKISYEAYFGEQSPWRKLNLLNAREYAIIQNESYVAAGRTPLPEFANPDALGEGTDWQDAIFQTAPISSHQLSLAGGSEKSAFSVSGNYFLQDGIVGGDKASFERYTVRLNSSHELKSWLSLGNTLGFTHLTRSALIDNSQYNSPLIRALNMDPVTPIRKSDGTFAYSKYSDTDITNPVNAIEQTFDNWTSNRVVGSIFGELRLSPSFNFRSTYSLDATFAKQKIFRPRFDLSHDPRLSDAPAQEKNLVNSVFLGHNDWTNWQWENVAVWQKTLADRHDLTLTAGNTVRESRFEFSGGSNTNLPSNDPDDAYISNTIDPIASQGAYGGASENSLLSYFGRVNYELGGKYLFSATFRADGSSKFGRNNRFGYFPSVTAGWILSDEDFFKMDAVSHLKLRASWGRNGNDRIGEYAFTSVVLPGQNYVFGTGEAITNGSVALTSANPDLKWETITQTDFGLDLELWRGKLNFIADYYLKKTSDMLYAAPIPFTAGSAPPVQNVANMENRGWEFALDWRDRQGAFKYSLGGNISFVKNEVTGLGKGGEPVQSGYVQSANANAALTQVVQPVASFFGYVTDGIFQTQAEVEAHAFQSENTAPGDLRFRDLNGDQVIDIADRTFIGSPIPDFTYGFTASADYAGFDFGLFLQGIQGNEVFNNTVRYDFTFVNRPASVLNRWTGEGTSNSEPRVNLNDPNQNARISDRFVEDGSFLRLKNVQLGYTLPRAVLDKIKFEKLRVYVSAQNLFTWTKYGGLDPEIGAVGGSLEIGIDRGFYPQARTVLGGVQLTF